MLTRSKQRALAAQSQTTENRRGHENFPLNNELLANWIELPPELLLMIFENLTVGRWSSKEPLFNCRLVHSRWKSAMDDLLEKRSLSFWRNWKQPKYNRYEFPVVYFNSTGKQTVENIPFPAFLLGDLESCPLPTKSVFLTFAPTCKDNWVLIPKGNVHFFSKCGHHLTSLTIELNGRKDFTASTLKELLTCTPHLKALALKNIFIKLLEKDDGNIILPPLPQLEHVRLAWIACRGFQFDAENWVLEPYKEQLISVRCMRELGSENSPANFPLLRRLHLYWPTPRQLLSPVGFPSLKRLDLMDIELNENRRKIHLKHVFKFLSEVASTLVELQLDIVKIRRSKANPINYPKDKSLQDLQKIQQSKFPALKKLTITYPKYEEEVKVVKDFLKMFPNLESLKFTRFGNDGMAPTEVHERRVTVHLKKEKYQGVCLKLRTINVYMGMENGERPFFTSRFPFSA